MTKFVIGIGSQRAGSTLLHSILDECTDVFMHPVKELHYYDTLYGVRNPAILKEFSKRQLNRELDRIISSESHGFIDKKYRCYLRANKILSIRDVESLQYLDLYRPCVNENNYLGEITPEYMILPDVGVMKMASDIGLDAKIILISRDPVDRFISAFKLLKSYGGGQYDKEKTSEQILEVLETMPAWVAQQDQLSDYQGAIKKYKKFFSNTLLISYEKITSNSAYFLQVLSDFLETKVNEDRFNEIMSTRVNSIGETGAVSTEVLDLLNKRYANNRQ